MSLTLIRHTKPLIDEGICYGRRDLDVAHSFAEDAAIVLSNLRQPEQIISSPLKRCLKLASLAADQFNLSVEIDPRVREMDFGNWEGVPWSDINRDELDLWAKDFMEARPHGGETVLRLRMRVHSALHDYQLSNKVTHIFTHAGVVKAALSKQDTQSEFDTSVPFGGIIHLPRNLEFRSPT